jgi:hypothetical protein
MFTIFPQNYSQKYHSYFVILTYSMEQSPSWGANWFSASQDIPHILWNPEVHYRIRKCLPPVPILSQLDPVHTPTSYFMKIHLNTLPSGHAKMRDCSPMCCWRVTHFYVFLHDVLYMRLSAGLAHLLLQGYQQLDAGCLGLKLQINRTFMTTYFYNHQTRTKGPLIQIVSLFSFICKHGFA